MKLTAKITSIIALLLTLTMVLTGCSALEGILDLILGGYDDPPAIEDPSGYTISAENQDGALYFSGAVSGGRFNGAYRETRATLVNLTEVDGGYIIHFVDNDEVTQYIVINDMEAGAALTTDKFEATIFEWNAELETYVVADDSNNRAFGVGKASTLTTFSCYDVSNNDNNYGKFTPVNNPTIEKGEGGKPTDGNGGNEGGNEGGNQGGNQGGNEGGNQGGNEGGNQGGNQGGNTDSFGVIEAPVVGTAYKFGMVQGNLDNAIYYLAGGMDGYYMATTTSVDDAIDVYLEETNGGYHLYCMVGGKSYINFVVSGTHVNGAYEATASTVYRYDTESKTLIAEVDGADYWLATRNDNTYTTMGPCKTSYNGFYGQFYGVGGISGGNQGGNEGGNQGGNQDNPFEGGFELGLVPAYDKSFGGYYVINNNTPYFTAEEIATAKAGCFEYYASRDNLGRATMAYACVCNNTRPKDSRGDISSVKPTGWVQKTYDNVPGGTLYNRSHLIAWSLTDEDANWENLVTGTEHMNQKVMTQFENQILSYIKASNSNKVLYRVTPIYNGNNLVCTGILLEAYSLNDNGEDISFCVFLYNVQPGISINYANGQSQKGDEAGQNSGLGGASSGGNNGNEGGTTVTPVAGGSYYVHVTNGNGTLYLDGTITSGRFNGTYEKSEAAKVTVSTVEGGYLLSFGSEYIVIGDTSSGASLTTDPSVATVFEWNASLNTYVVAEDSNNRGFGADATVTKYNNVSTYDISNTQYNWGVFTSVDGSSTPDSGNQGGTTVPDGNTGSGNTGSDNEDTYTFVLNTSSKKIHDPGCGSVATMSEKNKKEWTGTYEELQELLSGGYTTCGTCKPAVE